MEWSGGCLWEVSLKRGCISFMEDPKGWLPSLECSRIGSHQSQANRMGTGENSAGRRFIGGACTVSGGAGG